MMDEETDSPVDPDAPARERGQAPSFEQQARQRPPSLLAEFWTFLAREKKWWLIPIVVVLLLLLGVAWFGGTSVAPFVYPGL